MMHNLNNFWIGWIDTQNVSDITQLTFYYPELIRAFEYAIISCIDSNPYPLLDELAFKGVPKESIIQLPGNERGIMTDGNTVADLAFNNELFNGFDEIWFFHKQPILSPLDEVQILSQSWLTDKALISERTDVQRVLDWCLKTGAVLGISDGVGLNYITVDEEVAKTLERVMSA